MEFYFGRPDEWNVLEFNCVKKFKRIYTDGQKIYKDDLITF